MPELTKDQKRDYKKFFVEKGEKGFSPKRNSEIINKTIEKNDMLRKRKHKNYLDKLYERTDAVWWYFKSRMFQSGTPIEKYINKKELARLQGQKIRSKILNGMGRKIYLPE